MNTVDHKALFIIRLLFTLAMIASLCALASAHAEVWEVKLVQARGGLNVRASPSLEANAVYLLDDCETVLVLAQQDGWTYVARNNGAHCPLGWVCSDYLK